MFNYSYNKAGNILLLTDHVPFRDEKQKDTVWDLFHCTMMIKLTKEMYRRTYCEQFTQINMN